VQAALVVGSVKVAGLIHSKPGSPQIRHLCSLGSREART
jgi:hypothetical protein